MYVAKIAGSRYVTVLEKDAGQWYLKIKLDDNVEDQVALQQLSKRSIQVNLDSLFDKVNVVVNSFQKELILKELTDQIDHLLHIADTQTPTNVQSVTNVQNTELEVLKSKIEKVEKTLDLINERLERLEQLSQNS